MTRMSLKRSALALGALLAVGLSVAPAFAQQRTMKLAYFADPSRDAVLWAIRNGKVTSDRIKIEATPMQISELVQTMPTKTFDVVETSSMAIPFGRARGLDLKLMGAGIVPREPVGGTNIWVKKDSPIKTVADLKGKKIAVYSISSAADVVLRTALAEAYQIKVSTEGGDVQLIQMPVPAMAAALASGNVDGATLAQSQAYKAMHGSDFRLLVSPGEIMKKKYGLTIPTSLFVGYDEKLKKDPELYKEFMAMLVKSKEYALAHQDEVFGAVGKASNIEPAFFKSWFADFNEFPIVLPEAVIKASDLLWEKGKALGMIKSYEPAASVVWDGAVISKAPAK